MTSHDEMNEVDDHGIEHAEFKTEEMDEDAEHEVDDLHDSQHPKKKRRLIKMTDKKYECPHRDCGKSYSRAEHLYRHQLNHTPKQIYRCDFPGCDREFVRADLCARHKERHTAKGSHLQRKDAFLNSQRSTGGTSDGATSSATATMNGSPVAVDHASHIPQEHSMSNYQSRQAYTSSPEERHGITAMYPGSLNTANGMHLDPQLGSSNHYPGSMSLPHLNTMPQIAPVPNRRFTYDNSYAQRPTLQIGGYNQPQHVGYSTMTPTMPPPLMASPQSAGGAFAQQTYSSPSSTHHTYRSPSSASMLPSIPPYGFTPLYGPATNGYRSESIMSPTNMNSMDYSSLPNITNGNFMDFNFVDQLGSYAIPVFGSETPFNRSPPPGIDDNFISMLIGGTGMDLNDPPLHDLVPEPETKHEPAPSLPSVKTEPDSKNTDQNMASLSDGLDINIPQNVIGAAKHQRLVSYVQSFRDIVESTDRTFSASVLAGNSNDPSHVMSLQMLKTYLSSFWQHVHQQMPILHRPTFNAETCPDLLLLAMMCLGATCLERTHTLELTKASSELAFFVAHHIRWEIFKEADFRPPGKLWTFQTMLLLELFEKMFSTRVLHERGHIHHATTLTVMRRGSSLIGRSAVESSEDPTRTPPGPEGSINTSGQNTPDAWWNRWITAEATRRAAFAAFIIDSTHATLFGHSATMSPHDLRLALPCDEALWSAGSSAEVQRVEASLTSNGFKSISFVEGLKRTLRREKVNTNTFGRLILMAGLLNVSFHMNQRDLQVASLGASNTLGNKIKWQVYVTLAFDFWRKDFDESLAKNDHYLHVCKPNHSEPCPLDHREVVFEARTCLHSLAHMAMHVDIVDCQVFAGGTYALGRLVTEGDRNAVQRRMRAWAPTASARDATFYALRFLCEVLVPEEELKSKRSNPHQPPTFSYSARDDYLLNRPWVLYFAALIVWCYGYALDGPIKSPLYTLTSRDMEILDMQRYLIRMGGVESPGELEKQTDRNSCLGLLLLLKEKFQQPRWELMHEAGETLSSCIGKLLPVQKSVEQQS